jgi:hypothetical protein
MLAAFCGAIRTTLVGSRMPDLITIAFLQEKSLANHMPAHLLLYSIIDGFLTIS